MFVRGQVQKMGVSDSSFQQTECPLTKWEGLFSGMLKSRLHVYIEVMVDRIIAIYDLVTCLAVRYPAVRGMCLQDR